jgi:hypothetical protein
MQETTFFIEWYENMLDWLSRRAIWLVSLVWLVAATGCVLLTEIAFSLNS